MKRIAAVALATLVPATSLAQGAGGFDCLIEPSQVVEVRSPVDGLIAEVKVDRGDRIRRGQTLVQLQSEAERVAVEAARFRTQMEGQIASARHRAQYAAIKLARMKEMEKGNFVSAQARDEAATELQLAEAELVAATENRQLAKIELRRAEEQLTMRTMVAPFDGVVLDRMLHPGDLAESGSGRKPVLRVAQTNPLKVDIVLPAAAYGSVRSGARVTMRPEGMPGRYVAKVTMIDKVIDAASGTFVARVDLDNPKQNIPGGVRCTAEIDGVATTPTRVSLQSPR